MKIIIISIILGATLAFAAGGSALFSHGLVAVQQQKLERATNF